MAHMGSFVIVRKDGRPLGPIFVDALIQYQHAKINAFKMTVDPSMMVTTKSMLAGASEQDWETYYREYVDQRRGEPGFNPEDL